jgi:hypothetical protein
MKKTTPVTPSAAPGGALPSESDAKSLTIVAPGTISDDALMGEQLTAQYRLAVGGMREVLRFGAMMMALRDRLSTVVQVRTTGGKFSEKPDGSIKKWIEEHAPEIKFGTAFRFLHVAEAVAERFQTPAKISFVDLATKPTEELPDKLRTKQAELWEFVDGTSQRSWLDQFVPEGRRGGDVTPRDENGKRIVHKPTPEEIAENYRMEVKRCALAAQLFAKEGTYQALSDVELDAVVDHFNDFISAAKAWRALTKRERTERALAFLKLQ